MSNSTLLRRLNVIKIIYANFTDMAFVFQNVQTVLFLSAMLTYTTQKLPSLTNYNAF